MKHGSVSVTIVTFNSARFIRRCLEYVFGQDYPDLEVIIVDNASSDETPGILQAFESPLRVVYNRENMGFAAAQNQGISLSNGEWILALNPDVRLTPDFISTAVAAGESDEAIGSVSGKLLVMTPNFEIPQPPLFDSTGIYFTPNLRHLDRGSKEPDRGQYDRLEYVFGVTGAAALYRRKMIEDVSLAGEFFDSAFFAYREDADAAWRAQLLGWKCLYTPFAIAYHVRSVLPSNRGSVMPLLNMHSVKNRFLMRIKNVTLGLYVRHFFEISFRDLVVVGACLLREHSSLRAFLLLLLGFRSTWAKRREIMARRRSDDTYIEAWFSNAPVSFPAPEIAARLSASPAANR